MKWPFKSARPLVIICYEFCLAKAGSGILDNSKLTMVHLSKVLWCTHFYLCLILLQNECWWQCHRLLNLEFAIVWSVVWWYRKMHLPSIALSCIHTTLWKAHYMLLICCRIMPVLWKLNLINKRVWLKILSLIHG